MHHTKQLMCAFCRNAVYYSNRSAAAANLSLFEDALRDARMVVKLKPGWVKGHARAAAAYMGLQLYSEAKEAYEKAVKLEPDDQVGELLLYLFLSVFRNTAGVERG